MHTVHRDRRELCIQIVEFVTHSLRSKTPCLVLVAGESGYGKTTFVEQCRALLRDQASTAFVQCPAPLGTQRTPLYQPLYPFVKVLEQVLADPQKRAKRQLIVNIGLSVLGLIPLVGSIFDITKEVLRDMREYRRSQAGLSPSPPETHAMAESVLRIAQEYPLVLFLDDGQWIDTASVEVLEYVVSSERPVPLAVVLAYEPSVVEAQNPLLASWLAQRGNTSTRRVILPLITGAEIRELALQMLDGYQPHPAFEEWLLHQSGGVPAVAVAYLQYFRHHSPFAENGMLRPEILQREYRPASLQLLIEQTFTTLTEEDKLLLATCAAEGTNCSVFLMAQLLESDPVSTVRLLRSLQQRTGVIRSLGMQRLYGTNTTVYTFTHIGYYRYFVEYLEHEERVELHSRIAAILEQQARLAQDEALAEQLSPLIAAHYLEAGNQMAATETFSQLYHTASVRGHSLTAAYAHHSSGLAESDGDTDQHDRLLKLIGRIIESWYHGDVKQAYQLAATLPMDHASTIERWIVEFMRVRIELDLGITQQARDRLAALMAQLDDSLPAEIESMLYAMAVVADWYEQRYHHAWDHAQQATRLAQQSASVPATLIALTNMALVLKQFSRSEWSVAAHAAEWLARSAGYAELGNHLHQTFAR